jgi:hypothetical protein
MIQAIFSVIADQWQLIMGILLFIALCQILIVLALQFIFGKQLTSIEYFALGMAGWLLPASLISLLWFLFGSKPLSPFSLFLLISLFIFLIFFLLRFKPNSESDSKPTAFFLLLFFLVSVLLRLAFISKVVFPSYFDSAEHYLLIKNILGGNPARLIASLTTSYYHIGYHILTAFLTSTLQAEITKTMLLLGQMILAILPISIFFLIKHETRSNIAGVFAVIVAAYGWYMPAHVVDWGKYPALTSLGLIPFVLSLAYLLLRNRDKLSSQKRWGLYLLLGIGVIISGFIHSRSLIIFGIALAAWIIVTWQQKLQPPLRAVIFFIVAAVVALAMIYVQKQDVLSLLLDPYINKGIWVTILVLLLSLFAYKDYSQLLLTCIVTTGFLLVSLYIPVLGLIPGHDNLSLLDRPFVEMFLFLPLSLMGGLGLAGLEKFLHDKNVRLVSCNGFIGLVVCGLVLTNAYFTYELYPATCCVLVGNDDVTAMDWIANQLPTDTRIGISATELKVLVSGTFEGYVGGDAGIWITPWINRRTIPLLYNTNFADQAIWNNLCQQDISHLYVGELGQNFDDSQLSAQPARYKVLLSMPKVKVYQVVGCR